MAKGYEFVAKYWDKRATAEYENFQSTVMTTRMRFPILELVLLLLTTPA